MVHICCTVHKWYTYCTSVSANTGGSLSHTHTPSESGMEYVNRLPLLWLSHDHESPSLASPELLQVLYLLQVYVCTACGDPVVGYCMFMHSLYCTCTVTILHITCMNRIRLYYAVGCFPVVSVCCTRSYNMITCGKVQIKQLYNKDMCKAGDETTYS